MLKSLLSHKQSLSALLWNVCLAGVYSLIRQMRFASTLHAEVFHLMRRYDEEQQTDHIFFSFQ